jgi:hypothetical protein
MAAENEPGQPTSRSDPRRNSGTAWNHRETDLAPAARGFGLLGLIGPIAVWGYAGVLAIRGRSPNHSQRYALQVLSAASDMFAIPSLLAVIMGLAGVSRRGVGRRWRRTAAIGLTLGAVGIAATAVRWAVFAGK